MQMKLELKLSLLRIDISGEKIFPPVRFFSSQSEKKFNKKMAKI